MVPSRRFCLCRDPAEFDETFHINVTGAFATIKYFYPLLKVRTANFGLSLDIHYAPSLVLCTLPLALLLL